MQLHISQSYSHHVCSKPTCKCVRLLHSCSWVLSSLPSALTAPLQCRILHSTQLTISVNNFLEAVWITSLKLLSWGTILRQTGEPLWAVSLTSADDSSTVLAVSTGINFFRKETDKVCMSDPGPHAAVFGIVTSSECNGQHWGTSLEIVCEEFRILSKQVGSSLVEISSFGKLCNGWRKSRASNDLLQSGRDTPPLGTEPPECMLVVL